MVTVNIKGTAYGLYNIAPLFDYSLHQKLQAMYNLDDFQQALTAVRACWKSSKVLGIVTMVYQCSTILALYSLWARIALFW